MSLSQLWLVLAAAVLIVRSAACAGSVDFAESRHVGEWTHHPVFGDVSFDSFERLPGNPVVTGTDAFPWPVNGSLFKDTKTGSWFLYAGFYLRDYATIAESPSHCRVYRSDDNGRTWQDRGKPLEGVGTYLFAGETSPLWGAPDVSVCYKDGRYYMSFDWHTKDTTWADILSDDVRVNSGAACAVSDSPEGPFKPLTAYIKTREMQPLLGKYKRVYASTLLPRRKDWIALTLTDSGPYFGWALLGQTAQKPEGPWSQPKLLLHPQLDRYHPPLLEFFPQFVHGGYIHAPATSVAGNRDYQAIFRVPVEKAMDPEAWSLYQDGSVWHSEPVESEYEGIWGQTFSGFIDTDGTFNVMFPSRNSGNKGTISLARRPWNQPLRKRGFVISGHVNPGMSVVRRNIEPRRLTADMQIHGTVQIIWNHHGPLGPDRPTSGCGLHPLMRSRCDALELSATTWALLSYDATGERSELAAGKLAESQHRSVDISIDGADSILTLDGKQCWSGPMKTTAGRIGVWVEPRSSIECERFLVDGASSATTVPYLYTEGLVSAAQNLADWTEVKDPAFRFGVGAVSARDGVEAKWNFIGTGFALWAPTGPSYGKGELMLDGKRLAEVDFGSASPAKSRVIFQSGQFQPGRHAVILKATSGHMPIDVLDAVSE